MPALASLPVAVKVALWAVALLAIGELVDSALVAAVASVANTGLLLRHDHKLDELRRENRDLRRKLQSKRHATRPGEAPATVIDAEVVEHIADGIVRRSD